VSPKLHVRLTQVFLVANSLFWLPWGFICLVRPEAWSGEVIDGMEVFDLSGAVARTEVRADPAAAAAAEIERLRTENAELRAALAGEPPAPVPDTAEV
jgi:hypothetical protein